MSAAVEGCVFCDIIRKDAPARVVQEWIDAIAIVPINPVVDGHVLVIPAQHVDDFAVNPSVTAITMQRAAQLARHLGRRYAQCNLITSRGPAATQTVFHLHVHLVPRQPGDGLRLPWADA